MKRISVLIFVVLVGCSPKFDTVNMPDIESPDFRFEENTPIQTHYVNNFIVAQDGIDSMPDTKVEIILTEPITFNTLFQMLISQNINVIADFDTQRTLSIPSYTGSVIKFIRSIQEGYGLFFKYENGCLTVREKCTVFVKVLMPEIKDKLTKILLTFGIENSFYDELSSRIVFESDYYTFSKVQSYFNDNPYLSFLIFDVMVLESENSSIDSSGFDWHELALQVQDIIEYPLNMSLTGDKNGGFTFGFKSDSLSIHSVYKSLSETKKFNVLQSARISTLNGSNAVLDVSEKIPYISSVDITALSDNSSQLVQGYEFNTATNGIILKLTPMISDDIITITFESQIQSLIDFLEVGTSSQTIQQPILSIRNIKNQVVTNPGQTILIGGLQYEKGGSIYKSLKSVKSGLNTNESRSFSISVLLRCELIRYVFQKGGA